MDAEPILSRARNSISDFCINECHAFCCRKGYLVMSAQEASVVAGKNDADLKETGDGMFSLHLGAKESGCPSLRDNKCTIYKNDLRPKTCSDFPAFLHRNTVTFSSRCLAVKAGKMYPFVHELLVAGFEVKDKENIGR